MQKKGSFSRTVCWRMDSSLALLLIGSSFGAGVELKLSINLFVIYWIINF